MQDQNQLSTESARAVNPFGASNQRSAEVERSAAGSIAEVQAAMVIAQKFPRNPVQAMERIINACTRPTLAEGALYTYARGGTDISGPSIRLAEVCAQNWGNLSFGIRELEQRDGESTVEAFCWDMETNTKQVKVFQVPHIRFTRNGTKKLEDPRDIYEMVANQGARRLRACILGVIPGDVIEAAVEQCDKTLDSKADTSPEGMAKMLDAFKAFGVSKEMIETRIQRKLDSIRAAQVVNLKKIYASLRDGMSEPGEWFPVAAGAAEGAPASEAKKPQFTPKAAAKTKPAADKPTTPQNQPASTPGAAATQEKRETEPPAENGKGEPEQGEIKKPENHVDNPQTQAPPAEGSENPMTSLLLKMEEDAVRREEALAFIRSRGSKTTSFRGMTEADVADLLGHWQDLLDFQKNPNK